MFSFLLEISGLTWEIEPLINRFTYIIIVKGDYFIDKYWENYET